MSLFTTLKKTSAPSALALALVFSSPLALAFVEEVTAVFRPDPSNPMSNKF